MGIRMDYTVQVIPDTYVTEKIVYKYVPDPDQEQEVGKPVKKIRIEEKVIERGGWLFTFMRGHSIRLTDEKQIELLGLSTSPRLIDDSTGLEVNKHGIPLDIADHVNGGGLMDGGAPETAESLVARQEARSSKGDPIADIINDTE